MAATVAGAAEGVIIRIRYHHNVKQKKKEKANKAIEGARAWLKESSAKLLSLNCITYG